MHVPAASLTVGKRRKFPSAEPSGGTSTYISAIQRMEIQMRAYLTAGLLLGGVWFCPTVSAQNVEPDLQREVTAVREDLVRSHNELLKYIWTEQTEVLVGGKLKSSSSLRCGYDIDANIIRTPLG